MIRHQVYFDTLGSLREESASWRAVFAGLSVLRLVDAYADSTADSAPPNWAQLHSVRAAVDDIHDGNPVRGVLSFVIDEMTTRHSIDESVCAGLLSYGRALDYEANWALAADVFSTVARVAKPERNPRLAVEANIALGGAARRNGDWEVSARAYSQAAYVADAVGDRKSVLTVQVGIANTYIAKGNLPQAKSILEDVIVQAHDNGLSEVEGFALHSRASLAQRLGDKADVVKLAHQALSLTTAPAARDAVLEELAIGFSELGMQSAARDAHLILAATAQAKWVRWQATINLMEIASIEGMQSAFNAYADDLRHAPMGPWLKSYFLLFLGEGLERFGRNEEAAQVLAEAIDFSALNQINPVTFQAESALAALRATSRRTVVATPTSYEPSQEILAAANAISDLREVSLART
jgi:tetratricopeptide (TPR) repeat protein